MLAKYQKMFKNVCCEQINSHQKPKYIHCYIISINISKHYLETTHFNNPLENRIKQSLSGKRVTKGDLDHCLNRNLWESSHMKEQAVQEQE